MARLQAELRRYRELLEPQLIQYLSATDIPETLQKSMIYSIEAGGKRLRGCLCLAACELAGSSVENALPFACALEMIHAYSLIHDDLPCMDNDDFRRGKPTNHKVFGEGNAILAGDGLLSYAFEVTLNAAASHKDEPRYIDAALTIARGAGVFGMVAGQSMDLANERCEDLDADTLIYIHRHKTGALLTASILAGAIIGGASVELLQALNTYGDEYGKLFQITDDILDVTGDFKHMGKTLGKDASAAKLTYVTLYGLERAKEKAEQSAMQAKKALKEYSSAVFFQDLVEYTLRRDS